MSRFARVLREKGWEKREEKDFSSSHKWMGEKRSSKWERERKEDRYIIKISFTTRKMDGKVMICIFFLLSLFSLKQVIEKTVSREKERWATSGEGTRNTTRIIIFFSISLSLFLCFYKNMYFLIRRISRLHHNCCSLNQWSLSTNRSKEGEGRVVID